MIHKPHENPVDIAIIGAGAVGLACALCAEEAGLSVGLFGANSTKRDGRTVALLTGSWAMLTRLGVAQRLAGEASPLATMRLVDDTGSLFRQPPVAFQSSEIGLDAFGYNVETVDLVEALAAEVAARPGILRHAQIVRDVAAIDGMAVITDETGTLTKAQIVVGADGRNSLVRKAAKIEAKSWNYPQVALTALLSHGRENRDTSTEFHTRFGPCTLVPLPGKRSSLVWMMPPDRGAALMAMDDAALALTIERQTHSILGKLTMDGPRGLAPMGGLSVSHFTAEAMALIGEAAHVFPPIGAQGLNLGLRDVAGLIGVLTAAKTTGRMMGAASTLKLYDLERRNDVTIRTRAVDMLNRSLLSDFLPADFGRGLGMLALDSITPFRQMVMRQGLG